MSSEVSGGMVPAVSSPREGDGALTGAPQCPSPLTSALISEKSAAVMQNLDQLAAHLESEQNALEASLKTQLKETAKHLRPKRSRKTLP